MHRRQNNYIWSIWSTPTFPIFHFLTWFPAEPNCAFCQKVRNGQSSSSKLLAWTDYREKQLYYLFTEATSIPGSFITWPTPHQQSRVTDVTRHSCVKCFSAWQAPCSGTTFVLSRPKFIAILEKISLISSLWLGDQSVSPRTGTPIIEAPQASVRPYCVCKPTNWQVSPWPVGARFQGK